MAFLVIYNQIRLGKNIRNSKNQAKVIDKKRLNSFKTSN
jgi:hypothetical protein